MTIAIIGAGNVGKALGKAFLRIGQQVRFGVNNPGKYEAVIRSLGPGASLGTVFEAVAAADIVILAVPYGSAIEIAAAIKDWRNKILVDASNPLKPGLAGLDPAGSSSAGEEIAKRAKNARVVKAFNTTGADNMENATYAGGKVFMPICADDGEAKKAVIALAASIGFDAVDFGRLDGARYLEPLAMVWIKLAMVQGLGRGIAFSLLRR
ncbi:MAG: NADPH-dependent F420 reductase [Beijerinckiaceae bacterium]